jgi:hypothetical protein
MNNKNTLPFIESPLDATKTTRLFSKDLTQEDLKWHFDDEDRIISSKNPTDWLFQFDNKLPQKIDNEIYIKKGEWHRLIKGSSDIILIIERIL